MFGLKPVDPNKAPVLSGPERMLKALLPPEVYEMMLKLVKDGALEKIAKFADDLEAVKATLARIETHLARHNNGERREVEPGPGLKPCELERIEHAEPLRPNGTD